MSGILLPNAAAWNSRDGMLPVGYGELAVLQSFATGVHGKTSHSKELCDAINTCY